MHIYLKKERVYLLLCGGNSSVNVINYIAMCEVFIHHCVIHFTLMEFQCRYTALEAKVLKKANLTYDSNFGT